MSRLGRSYSFYKLRKPTVVGAVVIFRPVQVFLARQIPARKNQRVSYGLRPPPKIIGPAVRFRPVFVYLSRQIPQRKNRPVQYRLRPPAVTAAAAAPFLAAPVEVARARSVRVPRTLFELRAPTVVGVPSAPLAAPLRITYVRVPARAFKASSVLRKPVVVGPAVRFRPVIVSLTRPPRQTREITYKLRPPTAVTAPAAPGQTFPAVTVHLVPRQPPPGTRLLTVNLWAPQAVNTAPQFPGSLKALVQPPRQSRKPGSTLRPPTVVTPAVPPVFVAPDRLTNVVRLPAQALRVTSTLRKPVVLKPAVRFRPIIVVLNRRPKQTDSWRRMTYELRPPLVVGAPVVTPPASGVYQDIVPIVSGF